MTTAAIIALIEAAVTETPALYAEIKALFSSDTPPTAEQWAALQTKVASESFNG
jgi:hypothetical protein